MAYRRLKEKQLNDEKEKRKELFSMQNQGVFEERQKQRQRDTLRGNVIKATESLGSLVSKMGEQVQRSEATTTTLIQSSDVLKTTHGQYDNINATIKTGSKIISKYGRREFTDRILIGLALFVYFGVIFYILRKRLPLMTYLFPNFIRYFFGSSE
uniref:Sec20 n=1 Tax=Panagrolaimus sp. PS1159 TaxID=55785 RepID=A0AC35F9Y8_9BILA